MSRGRAWAIGSDGCGRLKFRWRSDCEFPVKCPGSHSPFYFLIIGGFYGEEVIAVTVFETVRGTRRL